MTHEELVKQAKAILVEAYEEAAMMVVLYLEGHPKEQLEPLCREIDPENWGAFSARVRRAKAKKASVDAGSSPTRTLNEQASRRHARKALKEASPKQIAQLIESLPPDRVEAVAAAAHQVQLDNIRKSGDNVAPSLADEDYTTVREAQASIRDNSVIAMKELFTALSRVRVEGIQKLVSNATSAERREWAERLPDEIALLQLACDLCKTTKLQAVK